MATSAEDSGCLKDIPFDDLIATLRCHPTQNIVASGTIGGDIILHSFSSTEDNIEKQKISFHRKAVRALKFSANGRRLFSASKDQTFCCVDSETGRLKRRVKAAHDSPIYSLTLSGENFVATGDDDGVIKVWDIRTKNCVMEFKDCDDFISDMVTEDRKFIIASSGEGTLTSFNLRRKQMELQSELFDSELICLAKIKRDKKLLCGTSEGVVNMFNWGEWGNISDRFPCGDDEQIDCIQPVTQDIVCVGTTSGHIRGVHILPNRILGDIGQHEEGFPIEALSLTADGHHIASCSHDQKVKFWNIEKLKRQKVDTSKKGTKMARKNKQSFAKSKKKEFFSGLVSDEEKDDEDDDDNSDDSDEDDDSDDDDSD